MFNFSKKCVLAATLLLSSSAAFSNTNINTISSSVEGLMQRMDGYSKEIGITVEQWQYAVSHFEMLDAGDIKAPFPTLDENPLYHEGLIELERHGSSQKLMKVVNLGKSNFATLLGLPVEKLEKFLSFYTELKETEQSQLGKVIESSFDVERITIMCDALCQNAAGGRDSLVFGAYLKDLAVDAGVGQYQIFVVLITDETGSSPNLIERAEYKYNNFSGAWKHKDLEPCSIESC